MDSKIEQIKRITEILKPEMGFAHMYPNLTAGHLANQIYAALYSQEPQKLIPKPRFDEVYKQCVENMDKSEPQPYCITEINRDGSITYKRIQPQSVSTPTEGMLEQIEAVSKSFKDSHQKHSGGKVNDKDNHRSRSFTNS